MTLNRIALAAALMVAATVAPAQTDTRSPIGGSTAPAAHKVYIVQLAAAPVAAYRGGVRGLAATQPAQGARLNMRAAPTRAYASYLDAQRNTVLARLGGKINVLHTYGVTFNGFAAQLTDTQVQALLASSDVLSVVESEQRLMDTTRTPDFIGLSQPGGIWSQLDGASRNIKGEDIIIGVIDGGVWPENPSMGAKVNAQGTPVAYFEAGTEVYGPPPAQWAGICQLGDGFTAAMCSNKLIGARYYAAGFLGGGALLGSNEYQSPRDGDGHGSHTSSTAGGNAGVRNASGGVVVGIMSGVAPRARVAVYKVCWNATVSTLTGCYTADTLRAIDDAVADGVDVINFSVSGTQTNFLDPVEIAYLNAATAGVFVAASAGNSGPGNEVAHMSPWLGTVASSTLDRQPGANLTLGSGAVYTGSSNNFAASPSATLVLGDSIAAAAQTPASALVCASNSLDSTAAAGKIVVCDRGTTNTAAARLAASAEVKRAGGVGMVLVNSSTATLSLDAHTVPTVYIALANRTPVRDYVTASAGGGTANISLSYNLPGIVAPVMSNFSSRGPNKANGNILKPDFTGPGSSIVAAYVAPLTAAQKAALIAGTFTPPSNFNTISGTSMSSPHMAGAAALLRQAYPTWSPAAIKSALMTTATGVKLSSGAADNNRWAYGAGHMNPSGADDPGLVYDITPADYGRFLCGLNLAAPAGLGTCATLGKISPWNLNLASLTAANVVVARTLTRTVKNVSAATSTYVATATLPGWTVAVSPPSLTLAPGASASYSATLTRTSAALGTWAFGSLVWSDGVKQVNSPLTALALALNTPDEVTDVRASGKGSKVFMIESSYTGPINLAATGLVPATLSTGSVASAATRCFSFVVPAGAQFARFQLFNSETRGGAATDLDMDVYRSASCTGTAVGTSASGTSDEVVTLNSPTADTYSVKVTGFAVPAGGASFTMSSWIVGPASGTQTLRATGPSSVYERGGATIGLGWTVATGQRYMGVVVFTDGANAALGSTKVMINNR